MKTQLGGAPALVVWPDGARRPAPCVLWYHGLSVDKETHRKELEELAVAGYLAIGIDAVAHGERRAPDLEQRVAGSPEESGPRIFEMAAQTVEEITQIIDDVVARGFAVADQIAVAGVSFGGCIAYGAVAHDPRIRTAISIIGTPEWPHYASPHDAVDAFCRVNLLSIVGEKDENVPPAAARAFHASLHQRCPQANHRLVEIANAPHLMNEQQWAEVMGEVMKWLKENL